MIIMLERVFSIETSFTEAYGAGHNLCLIGEDMIPAPFARTMVHDR
jgi:hypothetical protein